jgi:hypothetical protein
LGPLLAKYTNGPSMFGPMALSFHPQPARPHPLQSSMVTIVPEVEPIRHCGTPLDLTLSENCT